MSWSDSEDNILKEYFPYLDVNVLSSDFLPEKSKGAIRGKSKREGLEKDPYYKWITSIYTARRSNHSREFSKSFKQFVWGVTLAEGTFTIINESTRKQRRFVYKIEMVEDSLLDEIYETVRVGSIYTIEKSEKQDIRIWTVKSIGQINEVIIPLFDSIQADDWEKYETFTNWKEEFKREYNIEYCESKVPLNAIGIDRKNVSPQRASAENEQRIKELYPYIETSKISTLVGKSEIALKKKASRLGVSKIKNFELVRRLSTYDDSQFRASLRENSGFLIGYLSGDGSFVSSNGTHMVTITSNENDIDELQNIINFLGGYATLQVEDTPREDGWKRSAVIQVKHLPFFLCTLIPILESGEWYSASKREQFESWRDSLYERVNIDTLWERVEQHEQAKRQYEQLTNGDNK